MRDGGERISGKIPGSVATGVCRVESDACEGATTGSAKFIGPSASAKVFGRANAIASTIVASFMDVSFSTGSAITSERPFDRSIKNSFRSDGSRQSAHISQSLPLLGFDPYAIMAVAAPAGKQMN